MAVSTRRTLAAAQQQNAAQNNGEEGERPAQRPRVEGQNGNQEPQAAGAGGPPLQNQIAQVIRHLAANNPQFAPLVAQGNAGNAPAAAQDEDTVARNEVLREAIRAMDGQQLSKEMLLMIKDAVKNGLWRRIKMISNKDVRRAAARAVLESLDFESMQGNVPLQDRWLDAYEKAVARALNEIRSYIQSRLKEIVRAYKAKHGIMPPKATLLALIRRDFRLIPGENGAPASLSDDDFEQLSWWFTQVLPIAVGNTSDWPEQHHLYMTVQEGHYPENERMLYVTDSTEAMAVWIIENNYEAWVMQWRAKEEHGDYPIVRKAFNAEGEVSHENSYVSTPQCTLLCPFLTHTHTLNPFLAFFIYVLG
jgi:hypothetical protein